MVQVGEYELTIIDATIIVFSLIAVKKILSMILSGKVNQPKKHESETIPKKDRCILEVRRLRREEKLCLVVVNDKIYDLSGSRDLYENNRDTFEADGGCGAEWAPICERKYPFVGNLVA